MDKEAARALLELNPVDDERLIHMFLNSEFIILSMTVVYADENSKEEFYDSLQATVEKIPKPTC